MWDAKTGVPLSKAIVWQDTRTADSFGRLSTEERERITELTGLAIAPYFSASKIQWLLETHSPVNDVLVGTNRFLVAVESHWWSASHRCH